MSIAAHILSGSTLTVDSGASLVIASGATFSIADSMAHLSIVSTSAPQLDINYDNTHRASLGTMSDGSVKLKISDTYDFKVELPDSGYYFQFASNACIFSWPNNAFGVGINTGGTSGGKPRYSVSSDTNNGAGIGDGGASGTLAICVGGADKVKTTATAMTSLVPVILPSYTVSGLPTPTSYMRAFVTDATAPVFGSAVVGSGAVKAPVWYDGSNWIVG